MQVFMPYDNFYESLMCLDPSRLGNQIYRECKTLVNGGWKNHPASKIWYNHRYQLCEYALVGLDVLRTQRNRPYPKWEKWFAEKQKEFDPESGFPKIFGYKPYHDSHKSNLLRKNPQWYSQFNWDVPDDLPYIWEK